ncbi:hypothetical protein RA178_06275 [Shewanella oncorhynchi]|uniref:Phage head-tail joining protein n=1 Tax=Shewanella oncorhynchi TaxID=2726434 RepID=A0AA50KFI7_9GAMM|nr:hypothetical protein [Shewanella oncorhynchi]WMB74218.1 hypothetical protein RA178_06275 [Shewanella oncorhynchi]
MMISQLKYKAEIWEAVPSVDKYGVPSSSQTLLIKAPVAMKEVESTVEGNTTKSVNHTVQITMRHNRKLKPLTTSMYLLINDVEYDIVTPPSNPWGLNKYTTFNAVVRTK